MHIALRSAICAVVTVIFTSVLPVNTSAQSGCSLSPQGPSLSFEFRKPQMINPFGEFTTLSSALYLSGSIPVSNRTLVLVEMPFAKLKEREADNT